MNKADLRVIKTRETMHNALIDLLHEKSFVSIRPYPIAEVAKHEVATHQAAYWNGWADV